LTLSGVEGRPTGYLTAKPWRRVAATPSTEGLSRRCPPPKSALRPTGAERPAGSPASDAALALGGDLLRTRPTTWAGSVTSKQLGSGRLAIEGGIRFSPTAPRSRLTFTARFSTGELRGCSILAILRRPRGRY